MPLQTTVLHIKIYFDMPSAVITYRPCRNPEHHISRKAISRTLHGYLALRTRRDDLEQGEP